MSKLTATQHTVLTRHIDTVSGPRYGAEHIAYRHGMAHLVMSRIGSWLDADSDGANAGAYRYDSAVLHTITISQLEGSL